MAAIPKYLVITADAGHLPLKSRSVDMMFATPPTIGDIPYRKGDYCTDSPAQYGKWMEGFLGEANRILKPDGYLLMSGARSPRRTHVGKRLVDFGVLHKERTGKTWALKKLRTEYFWTHYLRVQSCWWAVRPWIYRELLLKYSQPGDIVAHVFSGSGNSGIASLELNRTPILLDLHYQRDARRRLANCQKFSCS